MYVARAFASDMLCSSLSESICGANRISPSRDTEKCPKTKGSGIHASPRTERALWDIDVDGLSRCPICGRVHPKLAQGFLTEKQVAAATADPCEPDVHVCDLPWEGRVGKRCAGTYPWGAGTWPISVIVPRLRATRTRLAHRATGGPISGSAAISVAPGLQCRLWRARANCD